MPHISIPNDTPGIRGLMDFKPAMGEKLNAMFHQLLRGPGPLSYADRERIATHVSRFNQCQFCYRSHRATVRHLDPSLSAADGAADETPVDPKLAALLTIAESAAKGGLHVTEDQVTAARQAGANDEEIHDTVLIAAAFCMANRYVDGLRAITPEDEAAYDVIGLNLATNGYNRSGTVES